MLLPQQIQGILYFLLAGWGYGFIYSFITVFVKGNRLSFLKGCVVVFYHLLFTSFLFWGLFLVNGGRFSLYFPLFFVAGLLIYYMLYMPFFFKVAYDCRYKMVTILKKVNLVKSRIVAIIELRKKARRRRKDARKQRKCRKKKKEEKTSYSLFL